MRISIITPSYNQGEFIEETIKSVIYQKGDFELEYIIFDAKSKDNTISILKRYDKIINSKEFKPNCKKIIFKWFSEKDSGQSEAINKGFKISTGEIINWLCSDDLLEEGALQKVSDFFTINKDAKVVYGNSIVINEDNKIINIQKGAEFSHEDLIRLDRSYHKFFIAQPSTFLKKEILKTIGLLNEDTQICMDYEWYLKINKKYRFFFLDQILSYSRHHKDSKTTRLQFQHYKKAYSLSKMHFNDLRLKSRIGYIFNYKIIMINRHLRKIIKNLIDILSRINKESAITLLIFLMVFAITNFFLFLYIKEQISTFYIASFLLISVLIIMMIEIYLRIQHNIDNKTKSLKNRINSLKKEIQDAKKNQRLIMRLLNNQIKKESNYKK